MLKKNDIITILLLLWFIHGCRELPVPKPRGYFRIDLPAKQYRSFTGFSTPSAILPFTFEYPVYSRISVDPEENDHPGWFNIEFPGFRARLHLTYMMINNNLDSLMEQTYRMNVKNHIIKADAINESIISDPAHRVYGIIYDLKGNTATAVQFFATDSINHYLRGSLYFSSEPDADSLAPVINFFREDVNHLIKTLRWKEM